MKVVSSIAEAAALSGSTVDEKYVASYQNFLDAAFSGNPVEAAWRALSQSADASGKIVKKSALHTLSYLCIRPFSANHANPTDAFLLKVTNKKGRPATVKKFYDYLTGETSPWKGIHDAIAAVRPDANGIPDAFFLYRNDLGCAKLAMSLWTAMRLHTCWGLDIIWERLVDAGFTEEEAILLATNFSWNGQTITVSNGPKGMHEKNPEATLKLSKLGVSKTDMPFLTNHSPSGFKALLVDKKPNSVHGTIASGERAQPNSFLWNTSDEMVNADSLPSHCAGKGKLQVSSEVNVLSDYLKRKTKSISQTYVEEVRGALLDNKAIKI